MKIILLEDVNKVGRRGEVRDVSDGYARNFLIPKKLALGATAGNLKNLDHIKVQANAKADRAKADAEGIRAQIEALAYEERRQASEEGKLFGSVTSQDLVDFLGQHGLRSSVDASARRADQDPGQQTETRAAARGRHRAAARERRSRVVPFRVSCRAMRDPAPERAIVRGYAFVHVMSTIAASYPPLSTAVNIRIHSRRISLLSSIGAVRSGRQAARTALRIPPQS